MLDKKIADKVVKSIEWSKAVQGGWQGSITFKNGKGLSVVAHWTMKMREAKSLVKDMILKRVEELIEEGTPVTDII